MNQGYLTDKFSILFIIFVTLGVYYPSIFAQVCSVDDQKMINSLITTQTFNLKSIFIPNSIHYYRPILYLTFIFDRFVWLCFESFMHLENILIHLINGILVFLCSKELLKRSITLEAQPAPMIISLLFVLHPINTESVCWISGRSDLMAATFIYLAFYLLLKRGRDNLYIIIAAFSYLLALLCKETALGFLPVLFMFLIVGNDPCVHPCEEPSPLRKRIIVMSSFLSLTIFYFILRSIFIRKDEGISIFTGVQKQPEIILNTSFIHKLTAAVSAVGFYAKKLFLPLPLNFMITEINKPLYLSLGLILIPVIIYILYKRNLYSNLLMMTISFILPALALIIRNMTWTQLAERYLYISSFGAAALFIVFYYKNFSFMSYNLRTLLLFILILVSSIITVDRIYTWQSNLLLFEDTVKKSPHSAEARNVYATVLAENKEFDKAISQFKTAQSLTPDNYKLPIFNLITIDLQKTGDLKAAKNAFIAQLNTSGRYKYEVLMLIIQLIDKEILKDEKGIHSKELLTEEIFYLNQAIKLRQTGANYYKLGQLYLNISDKDNALKYFNKSIEIEPNGYYSRFAQKLLKVLN